MPSQPREVAREECLCIGTTGGGHAQGCSHAEPIVVVVRGECLRVGPTRGGRVRVRSVRAATPPGVVACEECSRVGPIGVVVSREECSCMCAEPTKSDDK